MGLSHSYPLSPCAVWFCSAGLLLLFRYIITNTIHTMNSKGLEQARYLVKGSYISQGEQALNGRKNMVGSE